jgi:hypothetical protein
MAVNQSAKSSPEHPAHTRAGVRDIAQRSIARSEGSAVATFNHEVLPVPEPINLTVTMYGRSVTASTRLPIEITALFVADVTRLLDAVVPFPIQKDADQAA